jgi:Tfp pilus assembly protein PilF
MYRRKDPICDSPRDREAYKLFRKAELLEGDGDCESAAQLFRKALKMSPELAEVMGFM